MYFQKKRTILICLFIYVEKQPVLFIWMSVPWWVPTTVSALWGQNRNRIWTNIPQIPQKAARRNVKKVSQNILIQTGVVKAALLSLMHIQSPPYLKHKHSHIQIITITVIPNVIKYSKFKFPVTPRFDSVSSPLSFIHCSQPYWHPWCFLAF